MEIDAQPKLKFHGVDIFNVTFHSQRPSMNQTSEIHLAVNPVVFFPEGQPKTLKVLMDVSVVLEKHFELRLSALGTFEVSEDISPDTRKLFINQNAPAIMFPYVRSFIHTFSVNLGNVTGPILIPTQFFKGEIEELGTKKSLESKPEEVTKSGTAMT